MSPQRVSSTIALLLSLFYLVHLVSSQSSASPTATASTPSPSITYPDFVFGSVKLVSYDDVIRVSWANLPDNVTATLQIRCWNRNTTTTPIWFTKTPDLTTNLLTLAVPLPAYVDVPIINYKAYDPCDFNLGFPGNHDFVRKAAIGINGTVGKEAVVWSVDNPAPKGDIMATFQANTAAATFLTGTTWLVAFVCAITVGLVLC